MSSKDAKQIAIRNPFVGREDYNCFACAPHNPVGLKMRFRSVGNEVIGCWQPTATYQGYSDVLHGGIQATLMDETASWVVFVHARTSGVTMGMEVEFLRPVRADGGEILVRGRLERTEQRVAFIATRLFQAGQAGQEDAENSTPHARALCRYRLFSERLARKRLFYPGYDEFWD